MSDFLMFCQNCGRKQHQLTSATLGPCDMCGGTNFTNRPVVATYDQRTPNQCDGCARGLPVRHVDFRGTVLPCTAHLTDQRSEAVGGQAGQRTGDNAVTSAPGNATAPSHEGHAAGLAPSQSSDHQTIEKIPQYFAKQGIVEGLSKVHPVLLIRQMANEILRLRAAERELGECRRDAERWKEYAQHQEHCATCGEAVSDCETGTELRNAALNAQKGRQDGPTGEQHG